MALANRTHGAIQAELGSLIVNHLSKQGGPCTLVVAPGVIPHVQSDTNIRIPDLAVTCSGYDPEEAALTDPVLLIEILSPGNQAETWANVWAYTTSRACGSTWWCGRRASVPSSCAASRTAPGRSGPHSSRMARSRSKASDSG